MIDGRGAIHSQISTNMPVNDSTAHPPFGSIHIEMSQVETGRTNSMQNGRARVIDLNMSANFPQANNMKKNKNDFYRFLLS